DHAPAPVPPLHSFPTRRSSDLITQQPIPKFPGVTRDVALLVDETVTHQQIVKTIKENGGKFLKDVHLFDIYQGKGIEDGKKSVRSEEHTSELQSRENLVCRLLL